MTLAENLNSATEACPFDHLGWSETQDKTQRVTAWYPEASEITITNLQDKPIGQMTKEDDSGLFSFIWPKDQPIGIYKLAIKAQGQEFSIVDSYQFHERTFEDFDHNPEHLYRNLGAQVCKANAIDGTHISGVRFAVYAPHARSVSLIGSFNNWDGRRNPMHANSDGIWRLFVPDLKPGDTYKFEIKGPDGNLLPHKQDPYGFFHEQFPSFASVVFDQSEYQWQDQAWQERPLEDWREKPMSVYELHAGSWKKNGGRALTWSELIDELIPYVKDMNYTHIELLPVSEYPFDGSWGYQPIGLFAPTSRFGTPNEFKAFVDACHQNNISVIVDWVPAHFPSDEHGLAHFDGTALYEYEDPKRGWHPDWNSYVYDYGKWVVCDFLISSALIWLEHYHIDGLRVDAVASMLYLDYSREEGEWVPNVDGGNHNYEAIKFIKRFNESVYGNYPKAMTIAEESTSFDGVTRPVFAGGLGFGFKWNMGWMHDTLEYIKKDPIHKQYHHNEISFPMVYGYSENYILPLSHDEVVHGKGSILDRMPGDEWQKTANHRNYLGFMYAHPGKKLNFMGNEFAQGTEWNHQDQLDWYVLEYDRHEGVRRMFRDLNRLHIQEPALHQLDCDPKGFTWLNHSDYTASVISMARFSKNRQDTIVALCNFTPVSHEFYRVGVPEPGYYEVIFNSDAPEYAGSNFETGLGYHSFNEERDGQNCAIEVKLPPLATIYLKKK